MLCLARDDYPLFIKKSFLFTLIAEGELIGSFITQVISHLLLVLLLSVYVNLVKELFLPAIFQAVFGTVFPKASAKVLLFPEPTKFYFLGLNDKYQGKSAICGDFERRVAKMRVLRMKWGAWKK